MSTAPSDPISRGEDSSLILVLVPWPVFVIVSGGRTNKRSRMDPMIVGKSENDRPVAQGPPRNACRPR